MGVLDDIFGSGNEQDDYYDPLDVFDHLPDEVFLKLNKKIESLLKKISPEKLALDFNKACGSKVNILQAMMQDPDLFTALMVLKAADQLSIDIDVSVDDVLKAFDVNKPASSLPFPF
jgi:hypothetical protein